MGRRDNLKSSIAELSQQIEDAKAALDTYLEKLAASGIRLQRRTDSARIEALESAIAASGEVSQRINDWEKLWPLGELDLREGAKLSPRLRAGIATGRAMTPDDYQAALLRRDAMREALVSLQGDADGCITLAAPGAAPLGITSTGNAIFNQPGSALRCPAISLPLLTAGGLPLGVQLLGFPGRDRDLSAIAGFLLLGGR